MKLQPIFCLFVAILATAAAFGKSPDLTLSFFFWCEPFLLIHRSTVNKWILWFMMCCWSLGARLQLAALRKEKSSLAERLHKASKTSAQQQQELQSTKQNVQLRERDLMHVHQQYQMLYQQFVLLQQQAASRTVRSGSI